MSLQGGYPSCHPSNTVKALKGNRSTDVNQRLSPSGPHCFLISTGKGRCNLYGGSLPPVPVLGQPSVKRFAQCYQTIVSPVCLSVTLVYSMYCGQMVGWINMKLGMQVGLSPGHELDGEREREREFICHKIKKNIQNQSKLTIVAGYQKGKPISYPSSKRGRSPPPIFGPCLLWPNSCMD